MFQNYPRSITPLESPLEYWMKLGAVLESIILGYNHTISSLNFYLVFQQISTPMAYLRHLWKVRGNTVTFV